MLKFKAIMMVAIIVIAGVVALIAYRNTAPAPVDIGDEEPPLVEVEPRNFPVYAEPAANNEPCIAVNPINPDNVVAGGNDYDTPNGDSWCGYYWSEDGGKNWSRGLIPGYIGDSQTSVLTGYEGAGDPVVVFDSNGNCYYAGIAFKRINQPLRGIGRQSAIFVAKSTDGGKSFPQVSIVFQGLTRASFHDKEWIAVDPDTGYVYCVWALFSLYTKSQMLFSRSTDGGNEWSTPIIISDIYAREFAVQGAGITVDADGIIHIIWIDFQDDQVQQMRYTRSTDMGRTFEEARDVSDVHDNEYTLPNGQYRTPTLPALAVDRSGGPYHGYLYTTWNDDRNGDSDALLILSPDGGESWSPPIRVNDDEMGNGKDQFFSTVCVSPQGYVQLIFYDRREDPDNTLLSVYYAISIDGGQTFVNMNITDEQFDGDNSRGPFMGDYISIASSDIVAHAIWADTREGDSSNPKSDLYSARVVLNELELE